MHCSPRCSRCPRNFGKGPAKPLLLRLTSSGCSRGAQAVSEEAKAHAQKTTLLAKVPPTVPPLYAGLIAWLEGEKATELIVVDPQHLCALGQAAKLSMLGMVLRSKQAHQGLSTCQAPCNKAHSKSCH